jgi:2-polyprenyl-3-methyl-5-hydroxy-6-metoxy-1,4-benzoquinol methylase
MEDQMKDKFQCPVCGSNDSCRLNTYKHYCYVCNDCSSVTHIKKRRYAFNYILPASIFKKILPKKAYLRLFGDDKGLAADFYDVYAEECKTINEWRKSEFSQIIDEINLAGIQLSENHSVLDVSGGPGYIGYQLKEICSRVVVTEFSAKSVKTMSDQFGIETTTFDYTADNIEDVVSGKFDLILVRSSIIFCEDLNRFIGGLSKILNAGGHVLIETILPTFGEIFWWQQLEYKFPVIYSQESIEKFFYKNNFKFKAGFRDYGSYYGVKYRSYSQKSKLLFTWTLELAMIYIYLLLNAFKKPAIDSSMRHKMITQVWELGVDNSSKNSTVYKNYYQGDSCKSKTFGYKYNGYLKHCM